MTKRITYLLYLACLPMMNTSCLKPRNLRKDSKQDIHYLVGMWTSKCRLLKFENTLYSYTNTIEVENSDQNSKTFQSTTSYYLDGACKDTLYKTKDQGEVAVNVSQDKHKIDFNGKERLYWLAKKDLAVAFNSKGTLDKNWQEQKWIKLPHSESYEYILTKVNSHEAYFNLADNQQANHQGILYFKE